jgi:hypothetical protein
MKYDFIEIGTCDYHTLLQSCNASQKGLSVEPIKVYLDRLPDKPNVTKVNCAITSEDKIVDLFYVTPENQNKHNLPFTKGWGTIIKPHKSHGKDSEKLIESGILTKSQIQGITWKTLCEKYNVEEVNWVKIDAEGHDTVIVNSILDFCGNVIPKKISFEQTHCDQLELENTKIRLNENNYILKEEGEDLVYEYSKN